MRHGAVQRLLEIDGLGAEVILQHEVVIVENLGQLFGEALGPQQILHAQAAPRHLVFVGRADAAPGGADLLRALGHFARLIERLVIGQDQRAGFGNLQARLGIDAGGLQFVEFLDQRLGRQHHAVADVADDTIAQDAGGHQVQYRLLAADHQRVAGIVAALEAHHALRMVGEPVDDLALAFVAPLRADHDYVLWPCQFSFKWFDDPFIVAPHQLAVAAGFAPVVTVPRQGSNDDFSIGAQAFDLGLQCGIFRPRRQNRTRHCQR